MRRFLLAVLATACALPANGQIAGNSAYGGQRPSSGFSTSGDDTPPTLNSVFLEAAVLLNVKADTYVTVFGVSEEAPTVAEAREKVGRLVSRFARDVHAWNASRRVSTDFIAQNRVYGFDVSGDAATEKLVGFDVKENVSVPCASSSEADAVIALAARDGIFDLIKVDYVVKDFAAAKSRLVTAAAQVIRQKASDYRRLLGIKLGATPQLYANRFETTYPTESYASYQAAEGETIDPGFRTDRYIVHGARKMRTFYYSPLNGKGFDKVINPVVTEPVVQFTLYLKLRYDSGSDSRYTSPKENAR